MWLTKNEKKVLKLLIEDGKLSDTTISNKLNISSQAIGRIRKKLEEEIIKGYTLELDLPKLGINSFFICKGKLTPEARRIDKKEIEKEILENKNIITLFNLIGDECSYVLIGGFRNIDELNEFFFDKKMSGIHSLITCTDLKPLNSKCILKNDLNSLYAKAVDELGIKMTKIDIKRNKFNF
ncbi:MAG: Lrp/AsnC family transcriptional regulator [Candidatus Pacearchaeota archaeon]|jgi:DNA-binding Lrp family transcriptional regulator